MSYSNCTDVKQTESFSHLHEKGSTAHEISRSVNQLDIQNKVEPEGTISYQVRKGSPQDSTQPTLEHTATSFQMAKPYDARPSAVGTIDKNSSELSKPALIPDISKPINVKATQTESEDSVRISLRNAYREKGDLDTRIHDILLHFPDCLHAL